MTYQLHQGDCLEVMKQIPDKSVDMILCDLPYGVTGRKSESSKWDNIIPFEEMWEHYNRIIKPNGAIVLFGREPFTSKLLSSNYKGYKHKLVWNKKQSGSFQNAKYMPLQIEEDILVFTSKGERVNYYPIMRKGKMRKKGGCKIKNRVTNDIGYSENYNDEYYPVNILEFPNTRKGNIHPTQKPVPLLEYLIKTYSNENEVVLDNCMGSGSTGIACLNTNRKFIGIELDKEYFEKAKNRIENHEVK